MCGPVLLGRYSGFRAVRLLRSTTSAAAAHQHQPSRHLTHAHICHSRVRSVRLGWSTFHFTGNQPTREVLHYAAPFAAPAVYSPLCLLPLLLCRVAVGSGSGSRRMASHKRAAVEEGRSEQSTGEGSSQQPLTKKQRKQLEATQWNVNKVVGVAAKFDDPRTAIAAFERSQAEGTKVLSSTMLTLMHLAAGGTTWESLVRGVLVSPTEVAQSNDEMVQNYQPAEAFSKEEHLAASEKIFEALKTQLPLDNERIYTSRCRWALLRGDVDLSLSLAEEAASKGLGRLRTFAPALLGFCLEGQMDRAFYVKTVMEKHSLELTESEFIWMLEGCLIAKCFHAAYKVIGCMKGELVLLQTATLDLLQRIFESQEAKAHFAEGGALAGRGLSQWEITTDAAVSDDGTCEVADGQLRVIDLTPEEMSEFAKGIRNVVNERGKSAEFEQFVNWLDRNPREVMLDGANIALFGQNFAEGGWSFEQIQKVMNLVKEHEPGREQLVVLHVRRTNSPEAKRPGSQGAALLEQLRKDKALYVCPKGTNDDWYWLYAAVKAGERGLLVSNDEMRDHIFSLLAPKYFLRWKQHHQIKFNVSPSFCSLSYPPKYTKCIQELENGALVFPAVKDDGASWLVAKPVQ